MRILDAQKAIDVFSLDAQHRVPVLLYPQYEAITVSSSCCSILTTPPSNSTLKRYVSTFFPSCHDETKRVCSLHCMAHVTSSDRYVPSSYFNFYNARFGNRYVLIFRSLLAQYNLNHCCNQYSKVCSHLQPSS